MTWSRGRIQSALYLMNISDALEQLLPPVRMLGFMAGAVGLKR